MKINMYADENNIPSGEHVLNASIESNVNKKKHIIIDNMLLNLLSSLVWGMKVNISFYQVKTKARASSYILSLWHKTGFTTVRVAQAIHNMCLGKYQKVRIYLDFIRAVKGKFYIAIA